VGHKHVVRIKRVYDEPSADDGYRVLVDRVWPRGLSKDEASFDEWAKDVAPSTELRRWFGHDPAKFDEFVERYRAELSGSDKLAELRARCRQHPVVTLLYGAKDTEHNQAVVLRELLS
jgi:DNA-3-methyladenine glycosylase